MRIRCGLLALVLMSSTALAGPPYGVVHGVTQAVLQMSDTLRLQILKSLAQGDVAGAIAVWELETGHPAPQWLLAMQSAFSVLNQRAGPCAKVAQSLFEGFKQLGSNPSYIRFTTTIVRRGDQFMAFDRSAGDSTSAIQISDNALHFVVKVGDRFYDAMTGPTGLTIAEYMNRLNSPGVISMQTVSQLE